MNHSAQNHSGRYSCFVAANVSAFVIDCEVISTTVVTPASLSRAMIGVAACWLRVSIVAVSAPVAPVYATLVVIVPPPYFFTVFSNSARSGYGMASFESG